MLALAKHKYLVLAYTEKKYLVLAHAEHKYLVLAHGVNKNLVLAHAKHKLLVFTNIYTGSAHAEHMYIEYWVKINWTQVSSVQCVHCSIYTCSFCSAE